MPYAEKESMMQCIRPIRVETFLNHPFIKLIFCRNKADPTKRQYASQQIRLLEPVADKAKLMHMTAVLIF